MGGSEWMWENGTDVLERMCCLIAGLAVLTVLALLSDPVRTAALPARISQQQRLSPAVGDGDSARPCAVSQLVLCKSRTQ